MKRRNPYYKTLTHFKHKVVPSKKKYNSKRDIEKQKRDIFNTPKN